MTDRHFFQPMIHCFAKRKLVSLLLLGMMILSCSGYQVKGDRPRGIYHRVKSGETLYAIARAYNIKLQDLAEINNISNPDQIETDSVIFIPDASQVVDDVITAARSQVPPVQLRVFDPPVPESETTPESPVAKKEPPKKATVSDPTKGREKAPSDVTAKGRTTTPRTMDRDGIVPGISSRPESPETVDPTVKKKDPGEKADEIQFDKDRFIWPVKGRVISRFGIQQNKMNFNGIQIAASESAAVQAAAAGTVIFSAPLKDYGETIIIKHEDNYATVYTHLGTRTVRGEARVKKGDRIAFLGKSEKGDPFLYFEIRHKNKARNPLFLLP